jgi:hypothetical protein
LPSVACPDDIGLRHEKGRVVVLRDRKGVETKKPRRRPRLLLLLESVSGKEPVPPEAVAFRNELG